MQSRQIAGWLLPTLIFSKTQQLFRVRTPFMFWIMDHVSCTIWTIWRGAGPTRERSSSRGVKCRGNWRTRGRGGTLARRTTAWCTFEGTNMTYGPLSYTLLRSKISSYSMKFQTLLRLIFLIFYLNHVNSIFYHLWRRRWIPFYTLYTIKKTGKTHRTHSDCWLKCYNPTLLHFSTIICEYECVTCNLSVFLKSRIFNFRPLHCIKFSFLITRYQTLWNLIIHWHRPTPPPTPEVIRLHVVPYRYR